jgi:hypothetical protein
VQQTLLSVTWPALRPDFVDSLAFLQTCIGITANWTLHFDDSTDIAAGLITYSAHLTDITTG